MRNTRRLIVMVSQMLLASLAGPRLLAGEAPANPAAEGTSVRFVRVGLTDLGVKKTAATFLVPAGWKVEGRVFWVYNPYYPARLEMRAYSPEGIEQYQLYEKLTFMDRVRETVPFVAHAYPEGSDYDGAEVRRAVTHPGGFIGQFLIPRLRKELRAYKEVAYEDLPGLVQAASVAYRGAPADMRITAGRLRVEYQAEGRAIEEDFYCVLAWAGFANGLVSWQTDAIFSCRAEKGRLDAQRALFCTIASSQRTDLEWFNVVQQVRDKFQTEIKLRSMRAMEVSKHLTRINAQTTEIIRRAYRDHDAAINRVFTKLDESVRGVTSYQSPFEDYPVQMPSGYDYVWSKGSNEIILSNDAIFNPNRTQSGDWQLLKRANP